MNTNELLIDASNLSDEEKHRYYTDWKSSGLKALEFCKKKHLPFMKFRCWCKQFKKQETPSNKEFFPVSVKPQKDLAPSNSTLLNVGMKLPNDFQLQFTLSAPELLSFVRGLCHATEVIR
jgi:hypothetical protein